MQQQIEEGSDPDSNDWRAAIPEVCEEHNVRFITPWSVRVSGAEGGGGVRDHGEDSSPWSGFCKLQMPHLLPYALAELRPRMQWWYLAPGVRVFTLALGRAAVLGDDQVYPVHPSRYTIATEDKRVSNAQVQFTHPAGGNLGFDWLISLDGLRFRLDGGCRKVDMVAWGAAYDRAPRKSIYTTGHWELYAEEREPWVQAAHGREQPTVFHPDIPVWGPGSKVAAHFKREPPVLWYIPPVACPGLGQCYGGEAGGTACDHAYTIQSEGAAAYGRHAPVALDVPQTSGRTLFAGCRAHAIGTSHEGTTWQRGAEDEGFYVPVPRVQHFYTEHLDTEDPSASREAETRGADSWVSFDDQVVRMSGQESGDRELQDGGDSC